MWTISCMLAPKLPYQHVPMCQTEEQYHDVLICEPKEHDRYVTIRQADVKYHSVTIFKVIVQHEHLTIS